MRETTYLPQPPETLEAGPNVAAPSPDYSWTPGCWVWYRESYAWRPGYWNEGRSDWEWIPAHYVWTPRGYIFVDGFWDYSVARRGILFAPVFFQSRVYSRRDYRYSPTIAIDLGAFVEHLFLRPRYCHYYFGDYYASSYRTSGFYTSFAFRSSRYGYDPVYSHQRWEHRHDTQWERRIESSFQYRRDNESARPPRTWAAQRGLASGSGDSKQNSLVMAAPLDQLVGEKEAPVKLQPVVENERRHLAQRSREVQKLRENRRELEVRGKDTKAGKPEPKMKPTKVERIASPIVSKESTKLLKSHGRPPASRQEPTPNELVRPNSRQVPGSRSQTEIPGPQTVPRVIRPTKGNSSPREVPGTRPQPGIPGNQTVRPMVEPTKGKSRPQQAPRRTPQSENPKPKTAPRVIEPSKGKSGQPKAPSRIPQTEKPGPKVPRVIEPSKGKSRQQKAPARIPQTENPGPQTAPQVTEPTKGKSRPQQAPRRTPQSENPKPKTVPRVIEPSKGSPGRQKAAPREKASQPEIKPSTNNAPKQLGEESKSKSNGKGKGKGK